MSNKMISGKERDREKAGNGGNNNLKVRCLADEISWEKFWEISWNLDEGRVWRRKERNRGFAGIFLGRKNVLLI